MKPYRALELALDDCSRLVSVSAYLAKSTNGSIDASDILRSVIVLSISALDAFIHETAIKQIISIIDGEFPKPQKFPKLLISIDLAMSHASLQDAGVFEGELRKQLSRQTFQSYNQITEVLAWITDKKVWDLVAAEHSKPIDYVRDTLNTIVYRRNKIAHEFDRDSTNLFEKREIYLKDAEDVISFVKILSRIIDSVFT